MQTSIRFEAKLWRWREGAEWHFLTIDAATAAEIRYETMGQSRHFGSVKLSARIGKTGWQTMLWPDKEGGGFLIPVKASVRKAEQIAEGDMVGVELML